MQSGWGYISKIFTKPSTRRNHPVQQQQPQPQPQLPLLPQHQQDQQQDDIVMDLLGIDNEDEWQGP